MTETRDRQPKKDSNPMARSAFQVPGALRVVRGAAAGLLVLALAAGARAQSDELEQKDGKKVSGTVQSAYDHVELKTKQGAKQTSSGTGRQACSAARSSSEVVDKTLGVDRRLARRAREAEGRREAAPGAEAGGALPPRVAEGRKGDFDGSAGWQDS
jgi:hypothetical protein